MIEAQRVTFAVVSVISVRVGRAKRPALTAVCDTGGRGQRRTASCSRTRAAIGDSARADKRQEGLQVDIQLAGLSVQLGPEILPIAALAWRF